MRIITMSAAGLLLSGSLALAGGFELQALDTSAMYENGGFASFSTAKLSSNLNGVGADKVKVKTLKDQNWNNFALKFPLGNLDLGISKYRSGAIQMSGGNNPAGSSAPKADIELDTLAFLAKYNLDQNWSVMGGVTQTSLGTGNITTLKGSYDVKSQSQNNYVFGAAYSKPEIALRVEVLYQPGMKMKANGTYSASSAMAAVGIAAGATRDLNVTLKTPETVTLNFQTGIAKDTLLTASIHRAKWGSAQILAEVDNIPLNAANVSSAFTDTTKYSIGIGRKFSDVLSGSVSYSQEDGSGSRSESLFSMSNGSKAISAGIKYSLDNIDIALGVSHTMFGDLKVKDPALPELTYSNNSATTMGIKISTRF
jgi:long-chain fatty acid transport protein